MAALVLLAFVPGCSWLLGISDDPVVVDPSGSDGENGEDGGAGEDADGAAAE